MSHWTSIKTQIKDISALRAACAELGVGLEQNAEARGYGSSRQHAEHVIRLQGPYDIAVNKGQDGTYKLKTDWYAGHVEKEVGKEYARLIQLYGVHKATLEARRRGLMVHRQKQDNGNIRLVLSGGGL